MSGLVAVTGASGHLGRLVARELSTRGVRQRVITRSPARTPLLDDAEVAIADYADVTAMSDALDGAGMAHTALRDSLYADWAPLFVGEDGMIRGPAGKGTVAWVARADVARLAVAVLLDDTHAGAIYDVSGPVAIDMDETVRMLSHVTGREIAYHDETVDEARASRAGAGEDWQIEAWIGTYLAIATCEVGVTSHTIEALTGRRPMAFDEFLRATPEAWAHLT